MVEDVARRHARGGVEQGINMEVDHHNILVALALGDSSWLGNGLADVGKRLGYARLVGLLHMIHLFFQAFGVDDQRTCHLVVLDDGIEQGGLLEEVVFLERVQLVELHGIDAELHVDDGFQHEGFLALVGHHLNGHMPQVVELFAAELLDEDLGVGLHLAL